MSGNFFNMFEHYYALEPKADMLITEMRNTRYRQPAWYRYVAGFSGAKPVVVVENPYGGVVPELIDLLGRGKGYDRFRMSLYEAAALGVNMSLPYGSWMGSEIEDAFYAPHELCVEINDVPGRARARCTRPRAQPRSAWCSASSRASPRRSPPARPWRTTA